MAKPDNATEEKAKVKITRNSAHRNRHKKKANHLRNLATRSALYAKHKGANLWRTDINEWHETLKALSLGTA